MARRRNITGRPLLVATAAAAMVIGCGGGSSPVGPPPGDLMPPPEVTGEVCVDTTPERAVVYLNGQPTTERCTTVTSDGGVAVTVSAPGHVESTEQHELTETLELTIILMRELAPAPVGNLMRPQEIEPVHKRPAPRVK